MSIYPLDYRFIYYNSFSFYCSLKGVFKYSKIAKNYFYVKIGCERNYGTDSPKIYHNNFFSFFNNSLSFLIIRMAYLFFVSFVNVISLLNEDLEFELFITLLSFDYY